MPNCTNPSLSLPIRIKIVDSTPIAVPIVPANIFRYVAGVTFSSNGISMADGAQKMKLNINLNKPIIIFTLKISFLLCVC